MSSTDALHPCESCKESPCMCDLIDRIAEAFEVPRELLLTSMELGRARQALFEAHRDMILESIS